MVLYKYTNFENQNKLNLIAHMCFWIDSNIHLILKTNK